MEPDESEMQTRYSFKGGQRGRYAHLFPQAPSVMVSQETTAIKEENAIMAVAQLSRPPVIPDSKNETLTDETLTDEYLMRLPNPPGGKWEVVDGRLHEVATSGKHDQTVLWLGYIMMPYAIDLGMLTASSAGFRMAGGNLHVPDFGFTRYDRFPNSEVPDGFIEFTPDLAVEVISPSEKPADMTRKVGEYFASGARQVWHMFPETKTLIVFRSPTDAVTYQPDDTLDLSDILPGFQSRVSGLFGKPTG